MVRTSRAICACCGAALNQMTEQDSERVTGEVAEQNSADALWSQDRLAEILDVSPRTLERWRSSDRGPPYVQLVRGGIVRYCPRDVKAWLDRQTTQPTNPSAPTADAKRLMATRWAKHPTDDDT
jgi:hypothetical protein